MQYLPYMGGYPQKVVGESSTQPILFGVLGMFKGDQKFQGLQQVVEGKPIGHLPHLVSTHDHMNSEKHIMGAPAKTHIPGNHYGMVPFAGRFMTEQGHIEVYDSRHHHVHKHHDKYDHEGELMEKEHHDEHHVKKMKHK
jgi:hypothetical protein